MENIKWNVYSFVFLCDEGSGVVATRRRHALWWRQLDGNSKTVKYNCIIMWCASSNAVPHPNQTKYYIYKEPSTLHSFCAKHDTWTPIFRFHVFFFVLFALRRLPFISSIAFRFCYTRILHWQIYFFGSFLLFIFLSMFWFAYEWLFSRR